MKKIYLLLFLCNSFFSVHAQNKKELNASILRLQSDSAAMSNTLEEKERIILKKINKIEELHSLTKSNISEIENNKKIITENEKLISHKNIILEEKERIILKKINKIEELQLTKIIFVWVWNVAMEEVLKKYLTTYIMVNIE